MSPKDTHGGFDVEDPVAPAFDGVVQPLTMAEKIAVRKATQIANSPYHQAIAKLQEDGGSGVIDTDSKTYYFHDMFLGRSFETAQKLSVELKSLFGEIPRARRYLSQSYEALFNPTEDNYNVTGASEAFNDLMRSQGFKMKSLWHEVYSNGPSARIG